MNKKITLDGVEYELRPIEKQTETPETPKPKLPERWRDLDWVKGAWIERGRVFTIQSNNIVEDRNKNLFASEAYAQSALALAQLSQLYEAWKRIEFPDWKADWADEKQLKYVPNFCDGKLRVEGWWTRIMHFPFPTDTLCQAFIDCPEIASLLKTFYND